MTPRRARIGAAGPISPLSERVRCFLAEPPRSSLIRKLAGYFAGEDCGVLASWLTVSCPSAAARPPVGMAPGLRLHHAGLPTPCHAPTQLLVRVLAGRLGRDLSAGPAPVPGVAFRGFTRSRCRTLPDLLESHAQRHRLRCLLISRTDCGIMLEAQGQHRGLRCVRTVTGDCNWKRYGITHDFSPGPTCRSSFSQLPSSHSEPAAA